MPFALPAPKSPGAIAKIETALASYEKRARTAQADHREFTSKLFHDAEESLVSLATGIYYGRTGGLTLFNLDGAMLVGALLGGVGLFTDFGLSDHLHSVGKSILNSYITIKGFNIGQNWGQGGQSTTSSGNEHLRGMAGQTFSPASVARTRDYLM